MNNNKKIINIFLAGSTRLQEVRDMFYSAVSKKQTYWEKKFSLRIYAYTYENFNNKLQINGQQYEYDRFIEESADLIIFVLDGEIGGVTKKEFEVAWNAFSKNKKPIIEVLSKNTQIQNKEIEEVKNKVLEINQYWTPYDDKQLSLTIDKVIEQHITDILFPNKGSISFFKKLKSLIKRNFLLFSIASVFLLLIAISLFYFLDLNTNNTPKKDVIAHIDLMRYNDIDSCFDFAFSKANLNFFKYEDSINSNGYKEIYPKSDYLSFYDGDEYLKVCSPTDSIPYHFPILRLSIIENANKLIGFEHLSLIVTDFKFDDTPVMRFCFDNNYFSIINETQMNIFGNLQYDIFHNGQSIDSFKNIHNHIGIKDSIVYKIDKKSNSSLKARWSITDKHQEKTFFISEDSNIDININNTKINNFNIPFITVDSDNEYSIEKVYNYKTKSLEDSNRKITPLEHDSYMTIALKANKTCEFWVKAKFVSENKGKKDTLYSEPIHVKIFIPKNGFQTPKY